MESPTVFQNFTDQIATALPNVLGALLILLIGWLLAKGIRTLLIRLMKKTSWDERLFGGAIGGQDTNKFVGDIFYYVIMILVFLIVLETLGVSSVLTPLENMVGAFLTFIPSLIAAIIIGFIGYLLARFVSNLISFGGKFITKLTEKTDFKDTDQVVKVVRAIVFLVIFIPVLIQAVNALQLEAISAPLNAVLEGFVGMIGDIILAAVILILFVWGGSYLTGFLADLFQKLGFDRIAEKIHLQDMIGPGQSFSKVIAGILYFFIVFFGVITAVEILRLEHLSLILSEILYVTGSIAFGVFILLIGNFISRLVYNAMTRSEKNNFIASVVRYAILGLFIGIAFRAMGIANEIVELAFGLTLGSIAVVIALSYGLGGREAAGEHFREIIQKFKKGGEKGPGPDPASGPRGPAPDRPGTGPGTGIGNRPYNPGAGPTPGAGAGSDSGSSNNPGTSAGPGSGSAAGASPGAGAGSGQGPGSGHHPGGRGPDERFGGGGRHPDSPR